METYIASNIEAHYNGHRAVYLIHNGIAYNPHRWPYPWNGYPLRITLPNVGDGYDHALFPAWVIEALEELI